ncbi:MAG: hypothetical protein SOY37_09670, partial [Oscillospiraceae bacterium]|nr:hypothetical protein [Oscillospiraceae bacterium]
MHTVDSSNHHTAVRTLLSGTVFWFLTLLYLEAVLHRVIFGSFSLRFLYLAGFTLVIALLLAGLTLLPHRANGVLSFLLVTLLCILFASEIVYYHI